MIEHGVKDQVQQRVGGAQRVHPRYRGSDLALPRAPDKAGLARGTGLILRIEKMEVQLDHDLAVGQRRQMLVRRPGLRVLGKAHPGEQCAREARILGAHQQVEIAHRPDSGIDRARPQERAALERCSGHAVLPEAPGDPDERHLLVERAAGRPPVARQPALCTSGGYVPLPLSGAAAEQGPQSVLGGVAVNRLPSGRVETGGNLCRLRGVTPQQGENWTNQALHPFCSCMISSCGQTQSRPSCSSCGPGLTARCSVTAVSGGLQALKHRLTGYDRWGDGCDFADYYSVKLNDRKSWSSLIPRDEVPLTILSKGQLDLVETLLADLAERGIPGDCIEAGVWRGGTVILVRAALDRFGMADRQVIAADSFCGILPNTRFRHDLIDPWNDRWVASVDEVSTHLAAFGMGDGRIELLWGLFASSLPTLAGRRLAFIRLDCDSHDSVMDALTVLYPLLMPGGVVLVDDWHLFGCRIAIDHYRKLHDINDPIEVTAGNGYWFKSHAYGEPGQG